MYQVASALLHLQDGGKPSLSGEVKDSIIYKDLKPSNIIIDENKKTSKIIDFGTARQFSPRKKGDTFLLGTPGYAPPEAYTQTQTDLSADVYSFGATFYHLVTGQDPTQFHFNFPDPRRFNPNLTGNFASLLLDCLKKKEDRIPSALVLKRRLCGVWGFSDGFGDLFMKDPDTPPQKEVLDEDMKKFLKCKLKEKNQYKRVNNINLS